MRGTKAKSKLIAAACAVLIPACANGQESAPEQSGGLDDATIAHVAVTANAIDAEMGEFALERASTPAVRAFAETMVRDHRGVNARAAALAERLGLTPADNDVSRGLRGGAAEARSALESLQHQAFDRAYMRREVEYHRAVLQALDDTLIPNTGNAELRDLLVTARAAVAAHLARGEAIVRQIGGTSGG